jgi:carbon dioxide concentrating mechanism protein CcmO
MRPSHRAARHRDAALGLVSTQSFPAIVGTADTMLKSSDVILVGYEKIGSGHCTAVVRGGVADVRMAVQAGRETAQQFGQYMSSLVIPRPSPNLNEVLPIRVLWENFAYDGRQQRGRSQALGLLETRGFPAMVGAADAMMKSAEVELVAHETIGGGLCTALIRGSLPNVALAVEAGMHEAERIGELHAVMVIPRPLDDLEDSLPRVKVVEVEQPLAIPLSLEERAKELVALEEQSPERDRELIELPDLNELNQPEEQER